MYSVAYTQQLLVVATVINNLDDSRCFLLVCVVLVHACTWPQKVHCKCHTVLYSPPCLLIPSHLFRSFAVYFCSLSGVSVVACSDVAAGSLTARISERHSTLKFCEDLWHQRFTLLSYSYYRITPILRSLHWLRITERIEYNSITSSSLSCIQNFHNCPTSIPSSLHGCSTS